MVILEHLVPGCSWPSHEKIAKPVVVVNAVVVAVIPEKFEILIPDMREAGITVSLAPATVTSEPPAPPATIAVEVLPFNNEVPQPARAIPDAIQGTGLLRCRVKALPDGHQLPPTTSASRNRRPPPRSPGQR